MKPIAWYDPTNRMVSTDKDSPLFTPLGQVWPLYSKQEDDGITLTNIRHPQGKPALGDLNPESLEQVEIDLPERTWVGLTDEEIKAFDTWHDNREEEVGWCNPSEIVAYIEAKLKEKNG